MDASTQPVIGILCVDRLSYMADSVKSHIAVDYVEFLENAGAVVVPIWIEQTYDYYEQLLNKINGVLLPGGQVFVNKCDPQQAQLTNHCVRAAQIIISIAQRKNDSASGVEEFPIFGICLGFQLLVLYASSCDKTDRQTDVDTSLMANAPEYGIDPREECGYMYGYQPVAFTNGFRTSNMFANLSDKLQQIMETHPVFCHAHRYCVSVKSLNDTVWRVLGKNSKLDDDSKEFVTFVEHSNYPFYGAQIHPERFREELENVDSNLQQQRRLCCEYFGKFFVDKCRKNTNHFEQLKNNLINNFAISSIHGKRDRLYYTFPQEDKDRTATTSLAEI